MRLFSDSIGRKVLMAVTGLLMVLFVVGHLLGNLTIFAGPNGINAYAQHLHDLAPVVWGTRIVMGIAVLVHLYLSITITLENSAAKPDKYAVMDQRRATFMSRNMIWTGVIIGAFITYHLFHFTIGVHPPPDALGRNDVFGMVVAALGQAATAAVYLVAMISLFLHLSHGIQSVFQTLGLANAMLLPRYGTTGKVLSSLFLIGFGAIPVLIFIGVVAIK
jgi:succinate dehydrogenase / fumarate reductase cytochrome b subunit